MALDVGIGRIVAQRTQEQHRHPHRRGGYRQPDSSGEPVVKMADGQSDGIVDRTSRGEIPDLAAGASSGLLQRKVSA